MHHQYLLLYFQLTRWMTHNLLLNVPKRHANFLVLARNKTIRATPSLDKRHQEAQYSTGDLVGFGTAAPNWCLLEAHAKVHWSYSVLERIS